MKAIYYHQYGPAEVLQMKQVQQPIPKANELLIQIKATTVTSGDVRLRKSDFPPLFWLPARLIFGLFSPKKKILGHEFSGIVKATGDKVTKFNVGEKVIGTTTMLPTGSYAEYVCVPEKWKNGVIDRKPDNLSFEEAAALPIGGMTALFLLEKAKVASGQNILVYGASGSVGSFAVQLAKYYEAQVTAVCSDKNFEMVESLGADKLLNYRKEDYTKNPEKYDIVFDAVGKTNKAAAKRVLKNGGKYVSINMLTQETDELLQKLISLAESDQVIPYLDKSFKLEEVMAAHKYVETGRKRGNLVIEVDL